MIVRKPAEREIPAALRLARNLGLDYPKMEKDKLWIAEEAGRIIGLVALRAHPGCLELCSLGVSPRCRNQGVGRALVEALMKEVPEDVHLGTVIPEYFEKLGFRRAAAVPRTFVEKHGSPWCEDCSVDRCTVMTRTRS